jgi:hypothetical protein
MSVQRTTVLGFLATLAWGSVCVYGGAPMGPPMAALQEKQWSVGMGYGYGETDWKAAGLTLQTPTAGGPAYSAEFLDLDGLRTRVILGELAYGICDNWDLFAHVGFCDTRDNIAIHTTPPSGAPERLTYDGDSGPAWGLGTRATFCHWGPWRFGGRLQVTWFDPDADSYTSSDPDVANTVFMGRTDTEFWQTQVALGAIYQIDTLSFWAGPFLEFIEGDLDRQGRILVDGSDTGSFRSGADIEETTQLGLHLGVDWETSARFSCHMEGQFTADSWFVGVGGVMRMEELFRTR